MARDPDPEGFAVSFSGRQRAVAEYLLAEVLERQPEDVTRLLLRTSLLERVSGPLADRLTGNSGSYRILAEFEDAGALVVSLDAERSWFRYHHLFADLLALELRRTAPEELPGLHTIAAEWLAEHGHPVEAIRHAQAAENWGLAARLLADNWRSMYLDGRFAIARGLLSAFPSGMLAADAELAVLAAADRRAAGCYRRPVFNLNYGDLFDQAAAASARPSNIWVGDEDARAAVEELSRDIGMHAVNGGPLKRAAIQEDFGYILNAIVEDTGDGLVFYRFAAPQDL